MHIQVVTIFPELFEPFLRTSLVGRAIERGRLAVEVHDLRRFTDDPHRSVDDEPYGGGGGMVMTAPPWIRAAKELTEEAPGTGRARARRILLSPQGTPLADTEVRRLAGYEELLLMCGRYEGVDERVRESVVDEEVSLGDYVLSGGELPAMVLIEALSRQIPGVVGLPESVERDSFRRGLLDHPHYTRPPVVEGLEVPPVLLSGHHAEIEAWRRKKALEATARKRPDLLERLPEDELTRDERRTVARWLGERAAGEESPKKPRTAEEDR